MIRKICVHILVALAVYSSPAFSGDWNYRLSPYIWFAGLKGDLGTVPGAPSVPVDVSPEDAFQDTEAALMFVFDAKRGQHGLLIDFIYTDVQSDEELIPPPIELILETTTKTTIFTLAYEYEIYNDEQTVVDLLGGIRYWDLDSTLRLEDGAGILGGQKISNQESWLDPAVGVRARTPIGGSKFYVAGGAALGGFGMGSDLFYELTANIGYQWNDSIGTAIGYRLFDVDYEDNGYVYDVKQHGWQLGMTLTF